MLEYKIELLKREIKLILHRRYHSLSHIKSTIEKIVGTPISIAICPIEDLGNCEDNRIFWDTPTFGGTIWYLPTRNNEFYITELQFD